MPTYNILSWDPVVLKNETFPKPMITFKPDKDFIQYSNENKGTILVTFSGTESPYENTPLIGVVESSGYFPSYRPNYFNDTQNFTITLMSDWFGYPVKNGSMLIQGTKGADKLPEMSPPKFVAPKPIPFALEHYTSPPAKDTSMSYSILLLIFLGLVLVGLGVLVLRKGARQGGRK